jgi:uncharacterized protein (TIGR02145 family)
MRVLFPTFLLIVFQTFGYTQSVKIGTQIWSVKNLDVVKFRNGDSIPQAKSNSEWENATDNEQPAWCYYKNDPKNAALYGKLYNWYAIHDARRLAPQGWHIASDDEWDKLVQYLGGTNEAGAKMKTTTGWMLDGNGTNESGFSALPGGVRQSRGEFERQKWEGNWWTYENNGYCHYLIFNKKEVFENSSYKGIGMSVRCVKD